MWRIKQGKRFGGSHWTGGKYLLFNGRWEHNKCQRGLDSPCCDFSAQNHCSWEENLAVVAPFDVLRDSCCHSLAELVLNFRNLNMCRKKIFIATFVRSGYLNHFLYSECFCEWWLLTRWMTISHYKTTFLLRNVLRWAEHSQWKSLDSLLSR